MTIVVKTNPSRLCYNNNMQNRGKKGFTLIEATLGIAFLSILLITIAFLIQNVLSSYRKGTTIKSINTIGRNLVEDFETTVANSPMEDLKNSCSIAFPENANPSSPISLCESEKAYLFTFNQRKSGNIKIKGEYVSEDVPVSGVICTGKYSYIWNTGYTFDGYEFEGGSGDSAIVKYKLTNGGSVQTLEGFRLLKIADSSRVACSSRIKIDDYPPYSRYELLDNSDRNYDLTKDATGREYVLTEEPVELLANEENGASGAVLYDFSVYPLAQDSTSKHILISATFILGTLQGGVNITADEDYCETPDSGKDLGFDYCALNKFNFTMQIKGE